ncbi:MULTISPECIES: hypothetical protein [unclassified Chryseobacterium]|uniref:hypothetical protein n=1 Tax=unclassified Chryseobacterium TaxID=2593645 RepID=UPI0030104F0E
MILDIVLMALCGDVKECFGKMTCLKKGEAKEYEVQIIPEEYQKHLKRSASCFPVKRFLTSPASKDSPDKTMFLSISRIFDSKTSNNLFTVRASSELPFKRLISELHLEIYSFTC